MHGDKVPYQFKDDENKDYVRDMDSILAALNCREKQIGMLKKIFRL
jgi:hypothetical protein